MIFPDHALFLLEILCTATLVVVLACVELVSRVVRGLRRKGGRT